MSTAARPSMTPAWFGLVSGGSDEHHVGGIGQVGAGGEFPNQFPIDAGVCRENAVFLNVMTPPRDRAIPRVETSRGTELPTCIF